MNLACIQDHWLLWQAQLSKHTGCFPPPIAGKEKVLLVYSEPADSLTFLTAQNFKDLFSKHINVNDS